MNHAPVVGAWQRRARPLLGTLVEIGVGADDTCGHATLDAAFAVVGQVQACLSRFDADSDIARFHALRRGDSLMLRRQALDVLTAACQLQQASHGAFDISLGSAPLGWRVEGDRLIKLSDDVRLDLGGIGKGYAVDCAVDALIAQGARSGWVNAGGDLRAFGAAELSIQLRDERAGGVRPFASLRDGAFATSRFDPRSRSRLARGNRGPATSAHVSVAATRCLWADALTKVVAVSGDAAHPLLARFGASAWRH